MGASGRSQHAWFRSQPILTPPDCKPQPEAAQKATVASGVEVLTRVPVQAGKEQSYGLLRSSSPTSRLSVTCPERHVLNATVPFWQLRGWQREERSIFHSALAQNDLHRLRDRGLLVCPASSPLREQNVRHLPPLLCNYLLF